jgi:hypothetical protein
MDDIFKETDIGLSAFLCRCTPKGIAEADALMGEVRDRLGKEHHHQRVTASNLLSFILYDLRASYDVHWVEIACDQWFLVSAERYADGFCVRVQCDDAEDGIAAAWKAFADMKGRDEGPEDTPSPEEQDPPHPEAQGQEGAVPGMPRRQVPDVQLQGVCTSPGEGMTGDIFSWRLGSLA